MNEPPIRVLLAAAAVVVAVMLQGTFLARLPWPGGTPNIVLVLVVGVALAGGASAGMAAGFGSGLLADTLSAHPVGVLALCFTVVGFVVGLLKTSSERSLVWPILIMAAAAVVSYGLFAGLMTLLGAGASWNALPGTVAFDLVLTPFVVPVVAFVARRLGVEARR